MTRARLTFTCTDCGHPFTLTETAYAARRARYPDQMLCQRCISARWLAGRGRYMADQIACSGRSRTPPTTPAETPHAGA